MVLETKRLETRSTFAITRRPSATTPGRRSNLPSRRTSFATALVAGAPDPIATPISARLSAKASFTPSPVMATTCPLDCNALTIACFCSGETLPKTELCSRTSAISLSNDGRFLASYASSTSTPTLLATAATVSGLSPEMIFKPTPWAAKYARVSAASGRTCSSSITSATADAFWETESPISPESAWRSASTLEPVEAISSA